MNAQSYEFMEIIGRVLLGGFFAVAGIRHFFEVPGITRAIAARGMPFPKATLLIGSIFQTVAGAALMLGQYPFWAALALVVFTLAASVLLVNFWSADGEARSKGIATWQANAALIGGLLIAASSSASG